MNINRVVVAKALALTIVLGSVSVSSHQVQAESIEVSTSETKLKSHNQIHIKGDESQLAEVNKDNMVFIKSIALQAHNSGFDYGLYPSVTIAQAVLESRGGTSGLSVAPHHNLFGIKGSYQGNSVKMATKEDDGKGRLYDIQANFKSYPGFDESLRDHDKLLRYGLNGYYSGAWRENAKTTEQAVKHLEGKYATDTDYAAKLMKIIETYNLERFDSKLSNRDMAWLNSDSLDPWEQPVVEDDKVDKPETWASVYKNDNLDFATRLMALAKKGDNNDLSKISADKFYVEKMLNVSLSSPVNQDRYKRDPQIGDIAVYKAETGDNRIVESYSIVEGKRNGLTLISEGVEGESGLQEVYRTIPEASLDKFEFIDVKKLESSKANKVESNTEELDKLIRAGSKKADSEINKAKRDSRKGLIK